MDTRLSLRRYIYRSDSRNDDARKTKKMVKIDRRRTLSNGDEN